MKRKHPLILAATVLVTTTVLVLFYVQLAATQIRYHKWQMQRAWGEAFAQPDTFHNGLVGYSLGESYKRYEHHRQKLVMLGAVQELAYKLRNIRSPTTESSHFSKLLLSSKRPPCIDFESPYPSAPESMEIIIWCFSEHVTAWETFISDHDIVNYQNIFMRSSGADQY